MVMRVVPAIDEKWDARLSLRDENDAAEHVRLVHFFLLINAKLSRAHIDEEDEATTGIAVRKFNHLPKSKKGSGLCTHTMDKIWKKSYLAKSFWGCRECSCGKVISQSQE